MNQLKTPSPPLQLFLFYSCYRIDWDNIKLLEYAIPPPPLHICHKKSEASDWSRAVLASHVKTDIGQVLSRSPSPGPSA